MLWAFFLFYFADLGYYELRGIEFGLLLQTGIFFLHPSILCFNSSTVFNPSCIEHSFQTIAVFALINALLWIFRIYFS